jgi:hypothetical protein
MLPLVGRSVVEMHILSSWVLCTIWVYTVVILWLGVYPFCQCSTRIGNAGAKELDLWTMVMSGNRRGRQFRRMKWIGTKVSGIHTAYWFSISVCKGVWHSPHRVKFTQITHVHIKLTQLQITFIAIAHHVKASKRSVYHYIKNIYFSMLRFVYQH